MRYAMSNMIYTNGKRLGILAFDTRRRHSSKNWIPNITTRFPDAAAVQQRYGNAPVETAGIDPGEHISASFTALHPNRPRHVDVLHVRRKALSQPNLARQSRTEELKNMPREIKVEASASACETKTVYGPSISELERSYSTTYDGFDDAKENAAAFFYVLPELRGFYGSTQYKNIDYGFQCARRAEMDMAAASALKLVSRDNGLFIYGNAKFNTHTNLSSLHGTFKNFFANKVFFWAMQCHKLFISY
jgi:hypothetical protein